MATHISKCAGAKVQAFAPVRRMIILLADERPLGADPKPKIPIKILTARLRNVRNAAPGRPMISDTTSVLP